MILYLCLGIIVIGVGFVTIFFVVKEEENIFRAVPGGVFVALGIAVGMASLTLSGKVVEKNIRRGRYDDRCQRSYVDSGRWHKSAMSARTI